MQGLYNLLAVFGSELRDLNLQYTQIEGTRLVVHIFVKNRHTNRLLANCMEHVIANIVRISILSSCYEVALLPM